ncbi:rhomboid family intramembrane serine protease [Sediminitomix flava]|uniref:Rhomboid family protein n=1 Tax=Sediminitomix flava TaxID=379075 RepID=A0A315ZYS1_SEDFL|nr:rhomboid family intramembrane serine protease [Sediminitomix flava]PWJ42517.1 rhomboid family protein [Sediminitomix flava]
MSIGQSIKYPLLFIGFLWCIEFLEYFTGINLNFLGIMPRQATGLSGILFHPFLHGSFKHLMSNSVSLVILSASILFLYPKIGKNIIFIIYILTGIGVWLLARRAYHIGASGLIYGFASFLFFTGIFRKNPETLTISLVVAILYNGMLYGLIPNQVGVSWESHLLGAIMGAGVAFYYRKFTFESEKSNTKVEAFQQFEGYQPLENKNFKYQLGKEDKAGQNTEKEVYRYPIKKDAINKFQ